MKNEMVDRFLAWEAPDGGIEFHPNLPSWPIGTNLMTADQAKQMLNHVTTPLRQALVDLVGASAPERLKELKRTKLSPAMLNAINVLLETSDER